MRFQTRLLLAAALLTSGTPTLATPQASVPQADRVRLAEARRLRSAIGERVWPGWSAAPFALLLVTDSVEYLFWHPHPSPEFVPQGYDSLLGTDVFARPRRFATYLLATFPAVDQTPTIVVGQPANTRRRSTEWVLAVLHEHFHQHQFGHPGYYRSVDTLGLANGDETGMWMLNHPFPYDSVPIQRKVTALGAALAASPAVGPLVRAAFDSLRAALSQGDRRYLDFQLWQEGVAHYVEHASAAHAAAAGPPAEAFTALPDYTPYAAVADRLRAGMVDALREPAMASTRRVAVYPLGAALALVLDAAGSRWKERYFDPMFTLEHQVSALGP